MPEWVCITALNAKNWRKMVAPNAKLNNGSKCQNEDAALNAKTKNIMAPNAKLKIRLWKPNWKCDSERQTEDVALNAKLKMQLWASYWTMALNVELKTNNDSERQIEGDMMALNVEIETNNDSECQTEYDTLNAKRKKIW